MISVRKNANTKPNIIVQLNGPQKTTLSPPKKICGFRCWKNDTKLILNPTASGNKPSMVAMAVSITGMIRILPASMAASLVRIPLPRSSSVNSINKIPFLITIPANAITPTPNMMVAIVIPVKAYPSNTPMMLKNISVITINGLLMLLNCNTNIMKIIPSAMIRASSKNDCVSFSCSLCPLSFKLTSDGILLFVLKSSSFNCNSAFTLPTIVGSSTLLCNCMVRFTFFRFTAPVAVV